MAIKVVKVHRNKQHVLVFDNISYTIVSEWFLGRVLMHGELRTIPSELGRARERERKKERERERERERDT